MADDQAKTGKDNVRTILVQRLQEAGVQRPKCMTVSETDKLYERLITDLAYMTVTNLETLADLLLDVVTEDAKLRLPGELVIRQMARQLQQKPATEARIVKSWLRSIKGPEALEAGYAVELFRHLRKHGKPPGPYDMRTIREAAAENRRRLEITAKNERVDRATPDELAWVAEYNKDADLVAALVADGEAGRAA